MDRLIDLLRFVYTKDNKYLYAALDEALEKRVKQFIITANPEIITLGVEDGEMNEAFHHSTIVTADGVGVEKAVCWKLKNECNRNTGIDIAIHLLEVANRKNKSLFLYGAKKENLLELQRVIAEKYSGIVVVGAVDGYNVDQRKIREEIWEKQPDVLMVALGAPKQEIFIDSCFEKLVNTVCIGVGGAFDVLSGKVERAPYFFVKHNLEWLYRISKEPKRWKRFWKGNILFFFRLFFQK